jgi:hypothetical protein
LIDWNFSLFTDLVVSLQKNERERLTERVKLKTLLIYSHKSASQDLREKGNEGVTTKQAKLKTLLIFSHKSASQDLREWGKK